jgi:sRNA-binding protein
MPSLNRPLEELPLSNETKPSNEMKMRLTLAELAQRFPGAFAIAGSQRRPLAIGVRNALAVAAPDLDVKLIRQTLCWYCSRQGYLSAVARGGSRVGLAGNAAGEVSQEHIAFAELRLKERAEWLTAKAARKKAAKKAAREAGLKEVRQPDAPVTATAPVTVRIDAPPIPDPSKGSSLAGLRAAARARATTKAVA